MSGLKWVPVVDVDLCTGCGACVEACGPRSLEIRGRVAVLARPDTCGSEAHCIPVCPESCIWMAWVPHDGDRAVGQWRDVEQGQPHALGPGQPVHGG